MRRIFSSTILLLIIWSCNPADESPKRLFSLLDPQETGLIFSNDLLYDADFNVYTYRNYYNGGGVSIGDINGDNLPDIYLTSNLSKNRLFLNKGSLSFEDITESANVAGQMSWSTGVTMADINADGLLDIYVCNSGDIAGGKKLNELFINQGDLSFKEEAVSYGLADQGYSTHASFFDYDKDGDLDVYLLNNSYQAIGSFDLRRNERPVRDKLGGDKLLRNDAGQFVDVSEEAGIYGSVIGFGLGVTVGDVNNDDWDDIYISNDFFERDYLYINQRDGTFSEELTSQIKSISGASMGADMADINNDGFNDLFVTEMLPSTEERLKTVTTFESWDRYSYSVSNGYYHQFTRNTLQLNNTNGSFSEIGRLLGVEASDWSWGALIFDMDNDGFKDLFIANGIYQDLTDQDYLQYISNEEVAKSIITDNKVDYSKLIDIIPSNPIANKAFKNLGGLQFEDQSSELGLNTSGFSNGSAYADLDNDGDLDLVVNNVNLPAWLYQNNAVEQGKGNYLRFRLTGKYQNTFAVGTKIEVTTSVGTFYGQQQPTRGFQSSVDFRPTVGLPVDENVAVKVTWPSGTVTQLVDIPVNQELVLTEPEGKAVASTSPEDESIALFKPSEPLLDFVHIENEFVDFDRDRLLYHMLSTESPKSSRGDVNSDGVDDFFIGGSKGFAGQLYISSRAGYAKTQPDVFVEDKGSEDGSSVFFDADGDGDLDLYVASGGTEFSSSSDALIDRLYIYESGNWRKSSSPVGKFSTGAVAAADFDQDGDIDLFVGERVVPFRYGLPGSGHLLVNDGSGVFVEEKVEVSKALSRMGLITDAEWADLDGDGWIDLVVTGEYMPVQLFMNKEGVLEKGPSLSLSGWWNTLLIKDLDGDGLPEIVAGNHGSNSRFRASEENPIALFVDDYDQNGTLDPILSRFDGNEHVPYALRHNLIDQIKSLKKQFPSYADYQFATMEKILNEQQLSSTARLAVEQLSSVVLWNNGSFDFEIDELPIQTQFSPIYAISSGDFDKDGDEDLILGGNLFGVKPEMGRYDASYGTYLENKGNRTWKVYSNNRGLKVEGQVRDIVQIGNQLVLLRNDLPTVAFDF
ncbi:MAG: hypothetical protein ACI8QD_000449 [Cyclobacteriaceae bacterium]|jgi:hypothetical protein